MWLPWRSRPRVGVGLSLRRRVWLLWLLQAGVVQPLGLCQRLLAVSLVSRLRLTSSRGLLRTVRDRRRRGRIRTLESPMIRSEASGGTMVMMRMEMDNIVVPHPRVEVVVMHGKATVRLRGHSWVLPVASLRGLLVRVIGSREVSVAIVVFGAVDGAGTVHDNRPHLLLSSR